MKKEAFYRKKYSPGIKKYKDTFYEIRWDISGCNLRCQFCWSPNPDNDLKTKIENEDILVKTLAIINNYNLSSNVFIRFTGGEITFNNWENLCSVLRIINYNNTLKNIPILIQTNGIEIIEKNIDVYKNLSEIKNLRILFELSFKGTNAKEFTLLTNKESKYYEFQIEAYNVLLDFCNKHNNFIIVPVLGIYHSSTKKTPKYIFINPNTKEILFENINLWDIRFKNIWTKTELKWVETLKMSPKGYWDRLIKQCGVEGTKILRENYKKEPVNLYNCFPRKLSTYKYAEKIILKEFWK